MAYLSLEQFSSLIGALGSSQPKSNRIQPKLATLKVNRGPLGQFFLKELDSLNGISQ